MTLVLLLLAALVGGAANALAGGGTFLVFPALLLAGVASVKANATASLVLAPGMIASAWVYRGTLTGERRGLILQLTGVSLAGAGVGSLVLLSTSNQMFSHLVPWLLLLAAVVFTLAPRLRAAAVKSAGHRSLAGLLAGQFCIAVYGGYFGAGMGVLMIALFLIASNIGVQESNGVRVVCATAINLLAVALFAWRGALDWKLGPPMLAAGIVGGYLGARVVRKLKDETARRAILIYAWVLTAYFFAREIWS